MSSIHDKGRARERYFFYIEMFYNQELRFGLSEDILVREIPWGQNILIMAKVKDVAERGS